MGAWLSLGHARGQHYGDPRLRADRGWRWSGNDYRIKWPGHRFWSTRPGTVWGWQEICIQVWMSITWKVHFILMALFLCRNFICFLVMVSFHSINMLINVCQCFHARSSYYCVHILQIFMLLCSHSSGLWYHVVLEVDTNLPGFHTSTGIV